MVFNTPVIYVSIYFIRLLFGSPKNIELLKLMDNNQYSRSVRKNIRFLIFNQSNSAVIVSLRLEQKIFILILYFETEEFYHLAKLQKQMSYAQILEILYYLNSRSTYCYTIAVGMWNSRSLFNSLVKDNIQWARKVSKHL